MADSVATRVARLVAGGAHALLDKAENLSAEAVLAQTLREIDQIADEVRADLGKAEVGKHLVLSQIAKLNAEHEGLGEQIELAVSQNRDDLAGVAIGRQTDIEDLLPVLQKSLEEQSERAGELESYIVALNAKRREMEQTLAEFQAALAARGAAGAEPTSDRGGRVADAEAAFGRVLARQTGAAGLASGLKADAGKLRELAEMQRNHRIAERLAALKVGRGQSA